MTDDGERRTKAHLPSSVSRLPSRLGWLLVLIGAVADAIYHLPILLFGMTWPPAIDTIGEFGHSVIFVGVVMLIFAVLHRHQR